jgi:ketosteroid isomerase-like protein
MNDKHHHHHDHHHDEDHTFKKDELRIRKLDAQWGDAASIKDLDTVVGFYAPEGSLVWPETPPVHGTSDIRAHWKEMFKTIDGLKLEFVPERITFAPGGDLATDFGTVYFKQKPDPYTTVKKTAKYLVVWTKKNDSWKVLYDCYNLNA